MKLFGLISLVLCVFSVQGAAVWQVKKGQDILYIGGTFHLLRKSDYPLPAAYESAYKLSDAIILETDLNKMQTPEFRQKLMAKVLYQDGRTIKDDLSNDVFTALEKHLTERGIPIANFLRFKPGFVAMNLAIIEMQKMGFTPEGVDAFYASKAKSDNKPTGQLETLDEQLSLLANMGSDNPNAFIAYSLNDLKESSAMLEQIVQAWRDGDMEKLDSLVSSKMKQDFPSLYNDILVRRNKNWLPQIEAQFGDQDTEFFLVGAAHLAGDDSVLKMLKQKGYLIKQL